MMVLRNLWKRAHETLGEFADKSWALVPGFLLRSNVERTSLRLHTHGERGPLSAQFKRDFVHTLLKRKIGGPLPLEDCFCRGAARFRASRRTLARSACRPEFADLGVAPKPFSEKPFASRVLYLP
jgi:hypothetical protein